MIRKSILFTSLGLLSVLFVRCINTTDHTFYIQIDELIGLIQDKAAQAEFVDKWKLEPCYSDSLTVRYCNSASQIKIEYFKGGGFILTSPNFKSEQFDELLTDLGDRFHEQELKNFGNFTYENRSGKIELGKVYSDETVFLAVSKITEESSSEYVFVGNEN